MALEVAEPKISREILDAEHLSFLCIVQVAALGIAGIDATSHLSEFAHE